MGLASKLASAQAGNPAYPGGPPAPGGQPPQGGYPGQQQYQAYPGGQGRISGAIPAALQPGTPQRPQQSQQSQPYQMSGAIQPQGGYGAPSIPPRPGQSPAPLLDQYGRPISPYPPPAPGNRPTSPYPPAPQQQYPGSPQPPRPNQYANPQPGYGPPPPQQYNSYQAPPPQFQQQTPYGQPSQYGAQQQGYNPQNPQHQSYGAPQQGGYQNQSQQGGYGGPPPQQVQAPQNVNAYKTLLNATIQEKGLQNFYPPNSPQLDQIAGRAAQQVSLLATNWRIPVELASDIVKLALYDVILYVDDSGSMAFEENGSRIDDLKLILTRVAFATGLFDDDGIQVRFMNSADQGNGIRNDAQVNELVARTKFSGLTPMGRELQNKILGPLVLNPARSQQLRKPILVITITDGQPTGESPNDISGIIKNASGELARSRYGKGALAFQFAQVGNDLKAREFLSKLDEDKTIGDIIDCTSNYEVEADEMKKANPPVDLTPDMWLIKLLLGSIDSSYDSKDEKSNSGPPQQNYGAPQGGYGGPPQQGYGAPQGGYGGPQQGYGAPQYGGPQHGGAPQYGGPQQGNYPPQGGRGYPPQGGPGGYPPQQGGYQPPPPPRY